MSPTDSHYTAKQQIQTTLLGVVWVSGKYFLFHLRVFYIPTSTFHVRCRLTGYKEGNNNIGPKWHASRVIWALGVFFYLFQLVLWLFKPPAPVLDPHPCVSTHHHASTPTHTPFRALLTCLHPPPPVFEPLQPSFNPFWTPATHLEPLDLFSTPATDFDLPATCLHPPSTYFKTQLAFWPQPSHPFWTPTHPFTPTTTRLYLPTRDLDPPTHVSQLMPGTLLLVLLMLHTLVPSSMFAPNHALDLTRVAWVITWGPEAAAFGDKEMEADNSSTRCKHISYCSFTPLHPHHLWQIAMMVLGNKTS